MAKILVIEDDKLMQEALTGVLESIGHTVNCESDGRVGFENFKQNQYDLVITDYAMPVMKGDELALAIKARTPGQPVVMITAYAEMLKASNHPLRGVDFIISKPFLLENLRDAISKSAPISK